MSYKILLIDDSPTQLEMLRLQFVRAGYDVFTARDGSEGYKAVFETAPDLIMSDIMMPNINGYQLSRLLKNNPVTQKIPLILLTVLDKKIDKFWESKSGSDAAFKFISKTVPYEEIIATVAQAIQETPVSDDYKETLLKNSENEGAVETQMTDVLDELLMNTTFLNEFRELSEYLSHDEVLISKTFELLGSFIDYNIAGLYISSPDNNDKKVLHLDVNKNSVSRFVIEKVKRDFFANMPDMPEFTIRGFGHEVVREIVEPGEAIYNAEQFKTAHIVPIESSGRLLGGICFYNVDECNYPEIKFYKTMIGEVLLLLKMHYLYSETQYLSVTDGLTGLYNRRHFEHNVEREFLRAKRYASALSLAMIDIDHFKEINDKYGHQFGDYVLREISKIIYDSFRKTDMVYRYGGEELAVILTETSIESATIPLERLRIKIAQHLFEYNDKATNITISVGLGSYLIKMASKSELIETADKALYKAKESGRNKVVANTHEGFNDVIQV